MEGFCFLPVRRFSHAPFPNYSAAVIYRAAPDFRLFGHSVWPDGIMKKKTIRLIAVISILVVQLGCLVAACVLQS